MPYCSMPTAQYIEEANRQTFVVIQIEEEAALAHIDEIAAVKGVDVLFLGPGDYSAIGGYPGEYDHPKVLEATKRLAAAAKKASIHWGRPIFSPEHAEQCIDMGARFLGGPSDLALIKKSLESVQEFYATVGFTFDNRLCPMPPISEPLTNGAPHIRIDSTTSARN